MDSRAVKYIKLGWGGRMSMNLVDWARSMRQYPTRRVGASYPWSLPVIDMMASCGGK